MDGLPITRSPLRVALVAPPYFAVPPAGYGGVEALVADLAEALVEQGHRVVVLGAGRAAGPARFWPVWERTVPEQLGDPLPELAYAAAVRRAIEQLAAAGDVAVVHDHTLAGPLNAPAYARLGLPTVATVHGPVDADRRRFYQAVGADVGLVAISDRQRQLAPELNWLAVVHNALRVRAWPFRRRKQDYVLFLGRFHPEKGAHLAVAAAHAAGLPLVLAGKCADPAEREYFARQVVPRLGPRDRVFGPADAVAKRRLLANARCLLFPVQWEEPFGMVMIEAMACGTPVVALRAGSVPEVVMPGVTGLICDTPDQLPDALHQVTTLDPAACRAHVASRFGADRLGRRYSAVYRRAVTAGPGVPAPVPPAGEPAPAPPVAVGVIRQRLPGHDTDQPRRRPAAVAATSRPELP